MDLQQGRGAAVVKPRRRRGHDGVMMWWWWLEWCAGCVDRGGWSVGLGADKEDMGAEKRKEEEKKKEEEEVDEEGERGEKNDGQTK